MHEAGHSKLVHWDNPEGWGGEGGGMGVQDGRTHVHLWLIHVDVPILWPIDAKSWLIGQDPDAGKDWGQKKEATEDEMIGEHQWLNGHEFEQTPGDSEGQGSLECHSTWDCKESDTLPT